MTFQPPCDKTWAELIALSISEDLSLSEQKLLNEHVAECSRCSVALQQYNLMVTHIRSLPPVKPLPAFTLQRIQESKGLVAHEEQEKIIATFTSSTLKSKKGRATSVSSWEKTIGVLAAAIITVLFALLPSVLKLTRRSSSTLTGGNFLQIPSIVIATATKVPDIYYTGIAFLAAIFLVAGIIGLNHLRRKALLYRTNVDRVLFRETMKKLTGQASWTLESNQPNLILGIDKEHASRFPSQHVRVFFFLTSLLLIISTVILILNSPKTVLPIIFAVIGLVIALLSLPYKLFHYVHELVQGTSTEHRQHTIKSNRKQTLLRLMFLASLILSITLTVQQIRHVVFSQPSLCNSTITNLQVLSASCIGAVKTSDEEYIGLSDGGMAFDTNRVDGSLKTQAADAFKRGNSTSAISLLQQALLKDSNDAEALIYKENQRVLASGIPYITLVVGTTLTGSASNIDMGRDILQGVYVAQKEYNDGQKLNGGREVRLLIANAGSQSQYATIVAQQVVQATRQDRTILGVIGWPFSSYTLNAVHILTNAHIPIVSPTASSDLLSGISPYFFRITPTNQQQGRIAAQYAQKMLQATKVAVFVDNTDPYSQSLASAFEQQFQAVTYPNSIIQEEYVKGNIDMVLNSLNDALSHNPDLIFFAGYSYDANNLLDHLPTSGPYARLKVLGGDSLYDFNAYPSNIILNFHPLYFTTFAYPDEWDVLGLSSQKPPFFSEYANAFDPLAIHLGNYGYTRPNNNVILSYDAALALLQGCNNALAGGSNVLNPDILRQSLTGITGVHAIQGVSGQISFGDDGNPINKAIVVLHIDSKLHIIIEQVRGCFLLEQHCNSN